jgi:hypothetical protein
VSFSYQFFNKSVELDIPPFPPNVKHPKARAPAFTSFSVKIPLKTAGFEEKIYRKVEEVKEVEEKKVKKGLENKNLELVPK